VRDVGKVFSEAVSGDVPSGTDAFDYFAACITAQNGDFNKWDRAIGYSVRYPLEFVLALAHGIIQCKLPAGNQRPH
jgi:hypothetical protein